MQYAGYAILKHRQNSNSLERRENMERAFELTPHSYHILSGKDALGGRCYQQLVQQRMLVHGNYVLEALKKSSLHRQRLLSKYPSDSFLLKLSFPSLKLLFYNFHIRLYSISLSIQNTLVNLAKNSGFSAMAIANLLFVNRNGYCLLLL